MDIPKITTFLMFNNQAEEAVKLYTSLFEDSEDYEQWLSMVKMDLVIPDCTTLNIYIKWTSIHGD